MSLNIPVDELHWWSNQHRKKWTAQDIALRVPPWISSHSSQALNQNWLRSLSLDVNPLYAGTLGTPDFVRQTAVIRGIRDCLGGRPLHQIWEGFFPLFPPKGQLKNFFVALATVLQAPVGSYRFLLVGSQSFRPSGMWHDVFCRALLALGYSGVVHAYDPNQEIVRWQYSFDQQQLLFMGFASLYPETDQGSKYDIVIDDIYSDSGPGMKKWKSTYWSQKNQTVGCLPFFHLTEGRNFSHSFLVRQGSLLTCQCYRCSFEQMWGVHPSVARALSCQIEPHPCDSHVDSNSIALIRMAAYGSAYVTATENIEVRAVLACSKAENIVSKGNNVIGYLTTGPRLLKTPAISYNRETGYTPVKHVEIAVPDKYFLGKTVAFLGTSPSLVPIEQKTSSTSFYGIRDVAFVAEHTLLVSLLGAKEIFYPGLYLRTGFHRTGRYYKGYHSFVRDSLIYVKPTVPLVDSPNKLTLSRDFLVPESRAFLSTVEIYSGPDSSGFLLSAGITNTKVVDLDNYCATCKVQYCPKHQYFFPYGYHECEAERCPICQLYCGHCPHTPSFKCSLCKIDCSGRLGLIQRCTYCINL